MRTKSNEVTVLRCEEPKCGVSFMEIKGDGVDEKIGLAFPRKVAMERLAEMTGVCPRHTGR